MSLNRFGGLITGTFNPLTDQKPTIVEYLVVAGGGTDVGGSGGSGIVIIRYPNTFSDAISVSNGTKTTANGCTIYTFTSSGTITF